MLRVLASIQWWNVLVIRKKNYRFSIMLLSHHLLIVLIGLVHELVIADSNVDKAPLDQEWNELQGTTSTINEWLLRLYEMHVAMSETNSTSTTSAMDETSTWIHTKSFVDSEYKWVLVKVLGDNANNELCLSLETTGGFDFTGGNSYCCEGYIDMTLLPVFERLETFRLITPIHMQSASGRRYNSGQEQEPSPRRLQAGSVLSQAVQSLRVDDVRNLYGYTGAGLKVGVLSDSFNRLGGYANDTATRDLPQNVQVLKEYTGDDPSDEGRAMMQLIYDILPQATFAFYTAAEGAIDFAQGIRALAAAGCDVIVDDIGKCSTIFCPLHDIIGLSYNRGRRLDELSLTNVAFSRHNLRLLCRALVSGRRHCSGSQ